MNLSFFKSNLEITLPITLFLDIDSIYDLKKKMDKNMELWNKNNKKANVCVRVCVGNEPFISLRCGNSALPHLHSYIFFVSPNYA